MCKEASDIHSQNSIINVVVYLDCWDCVLYSGKTNKTQNLLNKNFDGSMQFKQQDNQQAKKLGFIYRLVILRIRKWGFWGILL